MSTRLFYGSSGTPFLDESKLTDLAGTVIDTSPLMRLVYAGNYPAIVAYYVLYWPFVRDFELVINERGRELLRYRKKLNARFSDGDTIIRSIAQAVAEMMEEEGTHAKIWQKDAKNTGIDSLDSDIVAPGVLKLVEAARTAPLWMHYCILGGTEEIAVGLSKRGVASPPFLGCHTIGRSLWSEVHLKADPPGRPSHHQIDRDLARALYTIDNPEATDEEARTALMDAEAATIAMFGEAALDVYRLIKFDATTSVAVAAE